MNQQRTKVLKRLAGVFVVGALAGGCAVAAAAKEPALKLYIEPEHVDADFQFQGEYSGTVSQPGGGKARLGAQVRALGDGLFRTMFYAGGLPGDGWDGKTIIQKAPSTDDSVPEKATPVDARLVGGKVLIDQVYKGACDGRTLAGWTDGGAEFQLARVHRKSPTLGAKPPAGAIVLFDGTSTDEWLPGAKLTPQKWLIGGATTKRKFQDFTLHVEFMISYVPRARAIWVRPNSGVFLQERYEIQILESFGTVEREHDCGVLYAQITPKINMCYPPLTWQTYDIDFTAARYDAAGKKTKLGRTTIKFNGVTILDDVEIKHSTPSGKPENPQPGGIYLQEHGFPAFFQNVWIVEKRP
jgi:hypothetical protein